MTGQINVNKIAARTGNTITINSGDNISGAAGSIVVTKHMIQYEHNFAINTGFSTTSSSMVDVTNFYVDITPKYTNSLLIFECTLDSKCTTAAAYARYRLVDSNNSDTVVHTSTYIGQSNYYAGTSEWLTTSLRTAFVAGTTSTMRLQLQMQLNGGGTFDINWSNSDQRVLQVTEIAQ